jgi:ketosteroid isomerase-like protein
MNSNLETIEKWKNEILQTEQDFAELAKKEGIGAAFLKYASEKAVLTRNNTLIAGKTAIKKYFENLSTESKNVSLIWKPDFVDISNSGDLGYTYGKYIYTFVDKNGDTIKYEGVFHTVWKRQENGEWKFVWD